MIQIEVKQGSVVDEDVDAIVCSANNWLILGSGVAGEIKMHGGPRIQAECDQIVEKKGGSPIEIGGAIWTSAGELMSKRLHLKYVIHAVGMGYKIRNGDDLQERILATPESIFKAVTSTLEIADEMAMHTIAFPLMCARPGYSTIEAEDAPWVLLATMMRAINSFAQKGNSISKIIICTGALSVRPSTETSKSNL